MQERAARWNEGQLVTWPKVEPYTAVMLVGQAGNIHISEVGRWHSYWHRTLPSGRQTLVHHGGIKGFPDLNSVKNQHERVILRYIGLTVDEPKDEKEDDLKPQLTFPQIEDQFRRLEIFGEQQNVNQWIGVLQKAQVDLPRSRTHGDLTVIRESLGELLQGNLGRAINRYKQNAALSIGSSLQGGRSELWSGINEAQKQLLLRAQQTVAITLGTMQRYNDLEIIQSSWNDIVYALPSKYSMAVDVLRNDRPDEVRIRRIIGVFDRLTELKGEPYFIKAQEFRKAENRIIELWQARNLKSLETVLTQQAGEAQIWKERIREQYEGIDFGRYAQA